MDEASTSLPTPEPEDGGSELGKQRTSRGRRAVLRSVIGVLVVAALGVLGYMVWDLRQQVDDLDASARSQGRTISNLESQVDDLERQVSSIDQFETYVTARELDFALGSIQDDVDDLNTLVCGRRCVLVGPFTDVDQVLIDLRGCVNEFIDAWASNGRAFYC